MANINFVVKNDIELKGNLIFEGATADAYETTLAITDPTADRTITFPNSTGTVALTSDLSSYAPLAGPTFTGTATIPTLNLTNALGLAYGGTGKTTASSAYANLLGYQSYTFSSTVTNLTNESPYNIIAQGSAYVDGMIRLPDVTTLALGWGFNITHAASGRQLTVASSNGNVIALLYAGMSIRVVCNDITSNNASSWTDVLTGSTSVTGAASGAMLVFSVSPTLSSPSIDTGVTTFSSSFALINTTATTLNIGGAATTLNIGTTSTDSKTMNLFTGATISGATKTLNIGTAGASGSTTTINIGSSASGATNNISLRGTTTATTLNLSNALGTLYGGTGLTSIGTAGQVLRVNAGATALEWGIGTSYIGTTQTQASSATQALTGISSITGATTLALDSTTTSALNIGTGANAKAITVGNNTTTTAVNVNTGNILNSATLGGGLDINDTINIHNATTTIASTSATSIFTDTAAYSTIEYTIQAKVGSNYRSSKIMLVCNGTTTTSFTEYAILENSANSIPVTFTATAASGIVTLNGAFTGWTTGNNITVKVVRTGIV